jgi:catechol 2,3-dioxygenase-like lactoylglutathione lyase family enzyme
MKVKLDMIGITVRDMAESLRFYRALGLQIPEPEAGSPYHEVTLEGGIRLSWNDLEMVKGIDEGWVEPVGHRMGLAFLCESPSAVDERYTQVVAAGFQGYKAPWDAFWGQRYAQVVDPDGNVVDLFCPL